MFTAEITKCASRYWLLSGVVILVIISQSGCDQLTDAATRLASDIKSAAASVGNQPGDRYSLYHTPADRGDCKGPYTLQVDKAGMIVFWCKDATGQTHSSPGTSSHRPYVDTADTFIVHKDAGETVMLEMERRNSKVVIIDVR